MAWCLFLDHEMHRSVSRRLLEMLHGSLPGSSKSRSLTPAMRRQLAKDLNDNDPWSLETNPYEHRRHGLMLSLLKDRPTYHRALEIGCAAGVFTAALSKLCTTLHVIDAMPQAIEQCRRRLGDVRNITYSVADIGDWPGFAETYDLIVVAEVLYYLGSRQKIQAAVRKIVSWLQPGGTLVFSSMVDAAAAKFSLIGAETTMLEWDRFVKEISRCSCHGEGPDEDALIVKYRRAA